MAIVPSFRPSVNEIPARQDLLSCLQTTPHRTLVGIAHSLGRALNSTTPKATLVSSLYDHLARPAVQASVASTLSAQERSAIQSLAANQGQVPLPAFTQHFGPVRPYRPWRDDSPRQPWRHPASTAESLLYQGLIYVLPGRPKQVTLPTEFLTLGRNGHRPGPEHTPPPPAEPAFNPILDLALFLCFLQQVPVRPLHGRWLTPHQCQALGACLSPPLAICKPSSELKAGRLPFIHYLAEALKLVLPAHGLLKPSPHASAWLAQPTATHRQELWSTLLDPGQDNQERWRRFRLPGSKLRNPIAFAQRLMTLLPAQPTGQPLIPADLVQDTMPSLDTLLPWWERETGDSPIELIEGLLAGPLSWLGAVARVPGTLEQSFWLINGLQNPEESAQAAPAERQPLQMAEDLGLVVPALPHPGALLALAAWTELSPGPRLTLSPASLAAATSQGHQPGDLVALLGRHVSPSPTEEQRAQLAGWLEALNPVTLAPALLLHGSSAEQVNSLWSDRALRSHLGRRLLPDLVTVESANPAYVATLLQSRGTPVRQAGMQNNGANPSAPAFSEAFWLVVSHHVHSHVARRVGLTPPPGAVLEDLLGRLDPAQAAAARAMAETVVSFLAHSLEARPTHTQARSTGEVLSTLERAVEAGLDLQMRYWSPWRGQLSERRVSPQYLEWRGDHRYLVAFCHLAAAERTFRVDRILDITQCDRA